ncbi:MAG TPA: N,N-dimethylformamidase beta subunit family domain-containing protein, partial [Ktedonobacteraceae bacterium]|nr:N,N-dimethylformamidase beta subunit family domain-containing protein [Ktedonobacteraceae bacterium]
PVLNLPENALIGIMYSEDNWDRGTTHFPGWKVSSSANSPLLNGTGLQTGQYYGCGLVGYEWDNVVGNGATPVGLEVLGATPTWSNINRVVGISNTAYYIALSGAMVFATGSIYWTFALDNYRFDIDKKCSSQDLVVSGMQKLMEHVMGALIVPHNPGQLAYAKPPATSLASLAVIALTLIDMPARLFKKLKKEL